MNKVKWLGTLFVLSMSLGAWADQNTATITVNVTINATPCKINNNQNIDVDFGDSVITTDVAKGVVEKDIAYTLDCTNADQNEALAMSIKGTGADFNADVLKTSIPELGINLKADGIDYPLNTELALANSSSKPNLKAVLVQQSGTHLPTGIFTAGATMTVDYQ